jgi:dynein intermediate chain 3, axonemal
MQTGAPAPDTEPALVHASADTTSAGSPEAPAAADFSPSSAQNAVVDAPERSGNGEAGVPGSSAGAEGAREGDLAPAETEPASNAKPPATRRVQLLDIEAARAILAEPFEEEPDRESPPSYNTDEHGARTPLRGVVSLFLTATTLELIGCAHLDGAALSSPGSTAPTAEVPKDKLLGDIQFRGAISDFHAFRAAIASADCDLLFLRANPTDIYGDGNNFELVTEAVAAHCVAAGCAEMERRRERDERIALRRLAAKSLPRSALPTMVCACICVGDAYRELLRQCHKSRRPALTAGSLL